MTFERTAEGQSNLSIFLNCDYVCYVEGDDGKEHGVDVFFWSTVLENLRPDLRIKFLSRGSKAALHRLATETVSHDIDNVLVAMDADYSRFLPEQYVDDRRVLYTYGYCWENDVSGPNFSVDCHTVLAKQANAPLHVVQQHLLFWRDIEHRARRLLIADFIALASGGSIIEADKPGRFVQKGDEGFPVFRYDHALDLCCAFNVRSKPRAYRPTNGFPDDAFRYLKGKVMALLTRYLSAHSASFFGGDRSISESHFTHISIERFTRDLRRPNPMSQAASHHRRQTALI